uniref:Uncharacterized protein n=1 Tax=Romanomermis culicivorax TaxID=13658 RepID=A0A915JZ02_ROMCU
MTGYWPHGAGVNADRQFASNSWLVPRQAENIAVLSKHFECFRFLSRGDVSFLGHFVQGEFQLLLSSVTRERFIECGRLVVGQIAVGGSGCYLAIGVGFRVL